MQGDVDLGGHDAGQGRLAQAGGAGEEEVVGGLAPAAGGLQDDVEVLLELGLADEVVEPAGPQPGLGGVLAGQRLGGQDGLVGGGGEVVGAQDLVAGHQRRAPTIRRRASLTSVDTSSPSGRSRVASATSSGV